jgi:hypothetical protein
MSWTRIFTARHRPVNAPPAHKSEDDIDEELMFHLRSLVDDDLAKGVPFDDAWRNAQQRFGSLRRYADACRSVTPANRLLFQGLPALGLVVLALLVGWLLVEVRSLRREQVALLKAQSRREEIEQVRKVALAATSSPVPVNAALSQRNDLTGRVLDRQNKPIPDANVLVILKTWPGGRYQQEDFATTSDADGRFCLAKLVPSDGQHAVQVAVVKDGYALTSTYQLTEAGSHPSVDPVTFALDAAARITLVVHDVRGQPVANARVSPLSRRSLGGDSHAVYFQASEPVQVFSDAEGRVGLGCFERGDQAEIYLRLPGKDWERHAIRIPSEGDVVVVSATQAVEAGGDPPSPDKKSQG